MYFPLLAYYDGTTKPTKGPTMTFIQAGTAHTPELCDAPDCWAPIRTGPNAHTAHDAAGYRHADPADCFGTKHTCLCDGDGSCTDQDRDYCPRCRQCTEYDDDRCRDCGREWGDDAS